MERSRISDCPFMTFPTRVCSRIERMCRNTGITFALAFREWENAFAVLVRSLLVFTISYRYGSVLAEALYLFSCVNLYAGEHTSGAPHLVTVELASNFLFDCVKIFWVAFLLCLPLFLVVLHARPIQSRSRRNPSLEQELQMLAVSLREFKIALRYLHEQHEQALLLLSASHRSIKTEDTDYAHL